MTENRNFSRLAYVLIMVAMVALLAAEATGPARGLSWIAAFGLGVLVVVSAVTSWLVVERNAGAGMSRLPATLLTVGAIGVAAADFAVLSGDLMLMLAHYVVLVQCIRLFQKKTSRVWFQLLALSLVHMVVAAVLTVEMWFAAPFLVYLALGVWTLMLFHARQEVERLPAGAQPVPRTGLGARAFFSTSVLVVVVLMFTGVFFAVSPRFNRTGLLEALGRRRQSGFSTRISLGDIVNMRLSTEPALWIAPLDGFPDEPLYVRGMALAEYERSGRQWEWKSIAGPLGARRIEADSAPAAEDRVGFTIPDPDAQEGDASWFARPLRRYRVLRLPSTAPVLFSPGEPVRVEFERWSAPRRIALDECRNVTLQGRAGARATFAYQVHARRLVPRDQVGDARARLDPRSAGDSQWSRETAAHYTALPPEIENNQRLRDLAARITDGASTDLDRADKIERFLRENYEYTLSVQPRPGVEPITDFLLRSKRGYCEYFSAGMVVLLRLRGVPARLVTGYAGGEQNTLTGQVLMRQSNAHAWVEIPFEGLGWVTFDSTPDGQAPVATPAGWLGRIGDWMRFRWNSYVVLYSSQTQEEALAGGQRWVREMYRSLTERVREGGAALEDVSWSSGSARDYLPAGGMVLGLSGLLGALAWVLRRRRGALGLRGPRARVAFYRQLSKILARHGRQAGPGETPREFTRRVARETSREFGVRVRYLAELFYRVRFGGKEPSRDEARRAQRFLKWLRHARPNAAAQPAADSDRAPPLRESARRNPADLPSLPATQAAPVAPTPPPSPTSPTSPESAHGQNSPPAPPTTGEQP